MTIKAIVTDIEGTTGSISFVKNVLFPYASKHLPEFVRENGRSSEVADILDEVRKAENNPGLNDEEVAEVLQRWIDEDRKVTPLKTLQGMIWKAGYDSGELKGHIYDDAAARLKSWKDGGIDLYVYSSGSVPAQKLLFANTEAGDLTPLFSGYFDTTIGSKLDSESYEKIANEIGVCASDILFLSDNIDEIKAADKAGMCVIALNRDGDLDDVRNYPVVSSFNEIDPLKLAVMA